MQTGRAGHWDAVYGTKADTAVSWFEPVPDLSLALVAQAGTARDAAVIDVGGGASRLADALLARGFADLTVLDLSAAALALTAARLRALPGAAAARLAFIAADVTAWRPDRSYALWHDRAAFHFLTDAADRAAYAAALSAAVPQGHAIIATFAPDGPERCSGLPVARHDAASVQAVLGPDWRIVAEVPHDHATPGGAVQRFRYGLFARG